MIKRRFRTRHRVQSALGAAVCLQLAGCGGRATPPAQEPAPLTAPAAEEPQETRERPEGIAEPKATTDTPQGQLGTLPEAVGVKAGSPAPDVNVFTMEGGSIPMMELVATQGPVMLVFYRGGWCPYCNYQVRGLTEAYEDFRKLGVTPVVISVDSPEEAAKMNAAYDIPFPVLSDPDLEAHKAYNVVQQVDDATFKQYKEAGLDLERASGRTHHVVAVPSAFLIDANGVVRWAHADKDYKTRPSTKQLLDVAKAKL